MGPHCYIDLNEVEENDELFQEELPRLMDRRRPKEREREKVGLELRRGMKKYEADEKFVLILYGVLCYGVLNESRSIF